MEQVETGDEASRALVESRGLETLPGRELHPFLAIARIVRTQGRRGEVLAEILTDFPERFQSLQRVFLECSEGTPQPMLVEKTWPHKGRIVLKFTGVDSIAEAEPLLGLHLLIPTRERVPLQSHRYYVWELEGCEVVVERGGARRKIGTVTEVEPGPGVPLLHVSVANRRRDEVLIPLAQAICTHIDPESKVIVIDPPEDLLELNESGEVAESQKTEVRKA